MTPGIIFSRSHFRTQTQQKLVPWSWMKHA